MSAKHPLYKVMLAAMVLSLFLGALPTAKAEIKLPALIGDRMILQQKMDTALWGWADPGEIVTVTASWNNKSRSVTADEAGKWQVRLPTPAAGGPYRLTFTGSDQIVLKDEYKDTVNFAKHRYIYDGRYKLIYIPLENTVVYEMYDVINDPEERNNIAAADKKNFHRLRKLLFDWSKRSSDTVIKNGRISPAH